jgi:pyruvate-formate lyase-activating enzyme
MPKIDKETDLEYRRRVIDIKSPSFCGAKWYNATIWLGSGMTTSCHHPPAHLVSVDEINKNPKALHNTQQKKQDRDQMKRGERPPGCEYCWKIEDMGRDAISDRVYKTVIYTDKELDDAFNSPREKDIDLRTLEIAFDRTCQFACSYCNPAFSTSWVRDIHQNGPYQGLVSDGRNHFTHEHTNAQLYTINQENPYVEAFFRWWETDLHRTLRELRITGGEPLMSGYTWRLIEWFKKNRGKSQTRLAINSNLGMSSDKIQELLDACEGIELDIYTSNESMGPCAEYIRDGLNWDQWCANMTLLMKSGQLRGLHNMATINTLCLESLPEFLTQLLTWKSQFGSDFPNFTLNILRFPSFQSPLVLPDDIRMKHKQRLETWLANFYNHSMLHEHERNHVQRLIDYLDVVKTPHSDAFDMPRLHNDFRKFYEQYDQRRGKNFPETFPGLADWYNTL